MAVLILSFMITTNFSDLNESNVFYSHITVFFIAIHGINEFFSRSLIQNIKSNSINDEEFYKAIDDAPAIFPSHIKNELKSFKTFTPIIFSAELNKKNSLDSYYFDFNKSSGQFNAIEVYNKINKLAEMLIINAYDILRSKKPNNCEVLEFFRHIRNAAAHNGKFHFDKKVLDNQNELIKIAKWNDFEIKSNLQGYKLFNILKNDEDNFWEYGDLIDFLLDLENNFIELKIK